MGTANLQSQLWGVRARDWAEVQEATVIPLYQAILATAKVQAGTAHLDIGCGAGMFCQIVAQHGAQISGLDATEPLLGIARQRVPNGNFRAGEMEELPYGDKQFDLVTGVNAFQYAENQVNAVKEARRVARSGAPVIIAVWGKAEDCQAGAYIRALGALLPPPPPGAPGPWALSQDGALEALATQAGLTPKKIVDVDCPWEYSNEATALRGLLSAGPAMRAIQHAGEQAVRDAVAKAIAPFKTTSGGYELQNKFRYLIATA